MNRCNWCNLKNPLYIKYHDEEWGIPNFEENGAFLTQMITIFMKC